MYLHLVWRVPYMHMFVSFIISLLFLCLPYYFRMREIQWYIFKHIYIYNSFYFVYLLQFAGSSIEHIMLLHMVLPLLGNEFPQASFLILRHCTTLNWNKKQIHRCVRSPASNLGNTSVSFPRKRYILIYHLQSIYSWEYDCILGYRTGKSYCFLVLLFTWYQFVYPALSDPTFLVGHNI